MGHVVFFMNTSGKKALRKYRRRCSKKLHSNSLSLALFGKVTLFVMGKRECALGVGQMNCSQDDNIKEY